MRILILYILLLIVLTEAAAQQSVYTLNQFAPANVNPSYIARDPYASARLIYRSQQSQPEIQINSTYFSANYPFLKKYSTWSSVGIELYHANEGLGGLLKTNGLGLIYGLNVPINKYHSISSGGSIQYFQRSFNTEGLTTGRQYVEGVGFDPSLESGEGSGFYRASSIRANWGISWQQTDRKKNRINHFGVSLYQLNIPEESFVETADFRLPLGINLEGSKQIYEKRSWKLYADAFYHTSASRMIWNSGLRALIDLYYFNPDLYRQKLELSAKYLNYGGAQTAAIWKSETFEAGISFELPLSQKLSHSSIFELGITYILPVRAKLKRKKSNFLIRNRESSETSRPIRADKLPRVYRIAPGESQAIELKSEQPINVVDTASNHVLYIDFELNNSKPKKTLSLYRFLKQTAEKLKNEPNTTLKIIGHTDDTGSKYYNQGLSEERALSIFTILTNFGVDPKQMTYEGKGESEPLLDNTDEFSRSKNRRVEMQFIEGEE